MRISDWSSDVCASDLTNAQAASNDRQWTTAYAIASRVDDAYAAGTDIRDQSLGERDVYTSLVWLAGTTAYYELKRPKDAKAMFQRYAEADDRTRVGEGKGLAVSVDLGGSRRIK